MRLADNDSVIENTFDIASRLVGTTQTWGGQNTNLGYAYDTFNRLATMSEPTGITAYTYDARAMLASLTDPGGNTFAFSYDALGRMASQSAPNGITTTPGFDAASQLTALNHNLGGTTTVASAAYTLNNTGSRSSELRDHRQAGRLRGRLPLRQSEGRDERARASQHDNTRSFGYDFVDRVLSTTNSLLAGKNESFTYDLEGNWTTNGRQHDDFNQLTEDNDWSYQYDLEGNLRGKTSKADPTETWDYKWDASNRLVKVVHAGNTVAEYAYDPTGRRIAKITAEGTRRYILNGANVLLELDAAGNLLASNTHAGLDNLLASDEPGNGGPCFIHKDGLNSTIAVTSAGVQ